MALQKASNSRSLFRMIASSTTASVADSFKYELEETIVKCAAKSSRTPSTYYKPSKMRCQRAMYYTRLGAPCEESRDAVLTGISESGADRHKRIQEAVSQMKAAGYDCEFIDVETFVKQRKLKNIIVHPRKEGEYETHCKHKVLDLSFMCDGIIRYRGVYYVLEIKTETQNKFYTRSCVDSGHMDQATAYSLCFEIPDVMFIYESRDLCIKKTYTINITKEQCMALVDKINATENCVRERILPDVVPNRKLCQYCGYEAICRQGEDYAQK